MKNDNDDDITPTLICIDWGSTNFRAFLLDQYGNTINTIHAAQGMLNVKQRDFEGILLNHLQPWLDQHRLPILMAGMVGSAQGWQEAGYCQCPADLNSLTAKLKSVKNQQNLDIAIVPGVKGMSKFEQIDVMRGEEVQIFGAYSMLQKQTDGLFSNSSEPQLICLPGTHSKWAKVANNQTPEIVNFTSYMTGELFNILEEHSLLGKVYKDNKQSVESDLSAFDLGVESVKSGGALSHKLFSARTNMLSGLISNSAVRSYLSGLLIATEFADMQDDALNTGPICLVGSKPLCDLYDRASNFFDLNTIYINSDAASCVGMLDIARRAGFLDK